MKVEKKEEFKKPIKEGANSDSEEEVPKVEEKRTPDQVEMLSRLTGCPTDTDTVLYALPMCAPYTMMTSHKYKIKL